MQYEGKIIEIDIIAVNDTDVVPTEVKTTLSVNDVKRFIEKLKVFNKAFMEFSDKKVYGAIGYLKVQEEADKFAMRQCLYVIRATGSSAVIVNPLDFKSKKF